VDEPPHRTTQSVPPEESKPTRSDIEAKTQEVVAEGVGATADEAIKDAYRNAVRQVVGAVVDAETLIQNDELIDDKVLTYSDGFIKGYKEVDGSKKVTNGLHRIKIKAQVERRSVVAKLKAANVNMKEVDGKGLFAEAVTQLDADKDAAELLTKQFEGFPQSCITATIIGKPVIVEKTADKATVKLTVQIEPDLKAFKAFSDKLVSILDKLAKAKGEFTAKFEEVDDFQTNSKKMAGAVESLVKGMPHAFRQDGSNSFSLKEKTLAVAVASGRTKSGDSIDYRYFMLDYSLQADLVTLATRAGKCKLKLLNEDAEDVVTETVAIPSPISSFGTLIGLYELGLSGGKRRGYEYESNAKKAQVFLVNSVFLAPRTNRLEHTPVHSVSVTLNLDLEELGSVKKAKVEVTFDE
jgi:hypothetical protein